MSSMKMPRPSRVQKMASTSRQRGSHSSFFSARLSARTSSERSAELPEPTKQVISIHGHYEPGSPESFGPRANGIAPERIGIDHLSPRPRSSDPYPTPRSPAGAGRD